jgi:hypothetical protein
MARTPPSRINVKRITDNLRLASRKGDRAALTLALDQMKILAFSPRYWERYLRLLRNPTARLVDLLVIKQGERIAHQKGRGPSPPSPSSAAVVRAIDAAVGRRARARGQARGGRRKARPDGALQPTLFD